MEQLFNKIDDLVNHDGLNLAIGLFLFVCGLNETVNEIQKGFSLGAHHGMFVFGLVHSIRSLSLVMKSAKHYKRP